MNTAPEKIRPDQVTIELEGWGKPLRLTPTLDAATTLSRQYNGLGNLVSRLGAYDLEVYIAIISAGAGVREQHLKRLGECIWTTGIVSLIAPLTKYCIMLANGGRMPPPPNEEEGEAPAEEEPDPSRG